MICDDFDENLFGKAHSYGEYLHTRYWVSFLWRDISLRRLCWRTEKGQRPNDHRQPKTWRSKTENQLKRLLPAITLPVTFTLSNRIALGRTMHMRVELLRHEISDFITSDLYDSQRPRFRGLQNTECHTRSCLYRQPMCDVAMSRSSVWSKHGQQSSRAPVVTR